MGGMVQRMPVEDVGAVAVEVSGGLAEEEGSDKRHEEHEVAGESGEDAHAIADEQGARAAAVAMVPVFIAAATAGGPAINRGPAAKPRIFSFTIDIDNRPRGKGGGHGRLRCASAYSCWDAVSHCGVKSFPDGPEWYS